MALPRSRILVLTALAATATASALAVTAPAWSTFRGRAGDVAFISTISEPVATPCTSSPTRDCSSNGIPMMTRRFLTRVGADGAVHRILLVPTDFGDFRFSPDAKRIAFGRTGAIYVSDAAGRHARRVARGAVNPTWSPDGRRLAFTTDAHSVWVVGADGRDTRRLTAGARDSRPHWSPDGRSIAFIRDVRLARSSPCSQKSDLYSVPADGGRARRLFRPGFACAWVGSFDWAPSGERLAVTVSDGTKADVVLTPQARALSGLSLLTSDGSVVRRLQPDGSYPVFAPDGRHIAFFGNGCQDPQEVGQLICTIGSDGRGLRRVTAVRDDIFAQFAPDWLVRR